MCRAPCPFPGQTQHSWAGIVWVAVLGKWSWDGKLQIPLWQHRGGRMGGWRGVLEPRRAQSQRVVPAGIQARLETEGVWRVPEVEGAAGKSRSRKFHFQRFAWICSHSRTSWHPVTKSSDIPTLIQPPASPSRGKLVWKDLLGRLDPLVPRVLQGSLAPMAFVGSLAQL